jgi:hypothetical protein
VFIQRPGVGKMGTAAKLRALRSRSSETCGRGISGTVPILFGLGFWIRWLLRPTRRRVFKILLPPIGCCVEQAIGD